MNHWKSMRKRGLAFILTLVVLCSCINVTAMPAFAREGTTEAEEALSAAEEMTVFMEPVTKAQQDDPEDLFAGYMEKVLYEDLNDGVSTLGNLGENKLQGVYNQKIYAALKTKIEKIAAGEITDAKITLDLSSLGLQPMTWTAAQLGLASINQSNVRDAVSKKVGELVSSRDILGYLLMDCPYELYWFDKTNGMSTGYSMIYNSSMVTVSKFTFSFSVASGYGSGNTVSNNRISIVKRAVQNAQNIVKANENKSDYEKLTAYRQEICRLVDYNQSAADNKGTPYGDPWQLIWVFDNDMSTSVVCEGYAKAFQYLCDLSVFTDAVCYTVTGDMDGGPHMWNIVTLGDKNYLVDVTNCDTGSIGADDQLFLVGARGTIASYTVTCKGENISYVYDPNQRTLLGDAVLTLSNTSYIPKTAVMATASQKGVITYGDTVTAAHLTGSARAKDTGANVAGSFSWASDVKSYGGAGEKTLTAIFTPDNTDVYDRAAITVKVTVAKKNLSVQANAASKSYGSKDPALTYTAKGLISGDSLTGALTRVGGEDVKEGGYAIQQGTLANPNYVIAFQPAVLTITPADYQVIVAASQNVQAGDGGFTQPAFTGVNKETVAGTLTYTYKQQTMNYEQLKKALSSLTAASTTVTVTYSFTATDSNYKRTAKTGTLTLTVKRFASDSDDENSSADSGVLEGTGSTTDVSSNGTRLITANPTAFNTIMLNWDAVSGAKSYEIFYSTSPNSGFKRLANVKKTFYKFSKAKCGVTYYFQMRVCRKGSKSEFGPVSYGRTDLAGTPALQVKKTAYNSITLRWSKVQGAKRYEIFYADSMSGTWRSLGTKGGTSFTHKGLTTGATYYYQIRPIRDSFRGRWSNGVSATTFFGNVTGLKVKPNGTDRMKLSWKKVKGATQYVILRADTIDGTYEVIDHTNRTSYINTGLMSGTTYFYKVYAVSGPYRTKETAPVGQTTKIDKK